MVISLIQPVIELVARDWITEVPTNLDVEEDLKKLLQDSHQLSNADDREAIDASLKECRTLLATIASPSARKRLQEQVDSDTAALEKLSKKVGPSRATQLAALQEAEKKLLTQGSERRDKQVSGAQKALARAETRREFFEKVREQLILVEKAVGTHEEQWTSMHEAKAQALEYHEKTMLARLQARIVAAEAPDAAMPPGSASDAEKSKKDDSLAITATQEAVTAKLKAERTAAEAAAQHAELLKKYETLQAQARQAEALQKQALALQQAELVFPGADLDMLPGDVTPKTGEKTFYKICGHLYQLLERWNLGGTIAFSMAELNCHALAKEETQSLMKKLLGADLWAGWFGAPDFTMADDSVLPRQLLTFLYAALKRLKGHYDAAEEVKTAAAKAYELLAEASAKKRKTAQ